ncbi:hypothetical protein BDP27DRAFT_1394455 [Rhodocollybia butyracea]|uniref:Uncharacterized protein n=1 Tax=Rhodocollybia butyracea TaxID=206335 RepID=A0A9P5P8C7_9AGAR|nr:hypothetical protein BDP27DRAFT_1394455 [Rhodocollybia butyracea]
MQDFLPRIAHFMHQSAGTAFLFTKSDIKTTLIPVVHTLSRLPHVIFWIWLHLLHFDVSNQYLNPEEDATNKSDRPLPSKRISLLTAVWLRWLLVPGCLGLSMLYSVETLYATGIALISLTFIYNEAGCHGSHWAIRNLVNAAGFASFEAGATFVSTSDYRSLDNVGLWSIMLSFGIFATTIHTIGRKTIPIVHPHIARWSVLIPLLIWSLCLSGIWSLKTPEEMCFILLSAHIGTRYLRLDPVEDDQVSFYWYNVWLSIAHFIPAYYRLTQS